MFGWSIIASACRSASKRAITCRVSMPGLMILSATVRWIGSVCSAMNTTPMPAFADLLQQLVGPDDRAGAFGDRRLVDRGRMAAIAMNGAHRLMGFEELVDPCPQIGIVSADFVQVGRPLVGLPLQSS